MMKTSPVRIVSAARDFFNMEAAGGIMLVVASIIALIVSNSPLGALYNYALNDVVFRIGFSDVGGSFLSVEKTVLHWINDGLMAVFFLLVGLEIKREMVIGELSSRARALLPVVAAIGGMAVPALIYTAVNIGEPSALRGWAIPGATDIAFALAVISLLGSRVPLPLKIFLTAIAIIDDLGAILIIAIFYTEDMNLYVLLFSLLPILGLFLLNRAGYRHRGFYVVLGVLLWLAVLKSGVHATLAGVVTALFVPVRTADPEESPARRMEHDLHPWVSYLILPVFGFANAGVSFEGMRYDALFQPIPLGIALGLVLGKQAGVFGASWLAIRSGLCQRPEGTDWRQIYGASLLCGIGFTMSLFIGGLAFSGAEQQADVRIGVIAGSLISAIAGYMVLRNQPRKADPT